MGPTAGACRRGVRHRSRPGGAAPASKEEFLALTGWMPTVRRPPDRRRLDPLRSPALTRALPGLAEALDDAAMAPRLRRMLADDWELLACAPGKAIRGTRGGGHPAVPPGAATPRTGETRSASSLAGCSATVDAAAAWRADVDLLADRLDDRDDLRAFAWPTVMVRELRLVLHAFPLDPALPGLLLATDPPELVEMLGPTLTSSVPGLLLQECRAEVVRYGPGGCVLRYELAWRLQPSRRSLKQVVYGKVYSDDRGRLVGPGRDRAPAARPDGPGSSCRSWCPGSRPICPTSGWPSSRRRPGRRCCPH